MDLHAKLTCPNCGVNFNDRVFHSECTSCGGLLDLDVAADARGAQLKARFADRLGQFGSGVWRYQELVLPTIGDDIITWPEGNTPLIPYLPNMMIKHEGMN